MNDKKKVPTIRVTDKCVACPFFHLVFNSDDVIEGIGMCSKYHVRWLWPRDPSAKLNLSKTEPKYHRQLIECYKCMNSENPEGYFLPLDDDEGPTEVTYVVTNEGGQGIYQTIFDRYICSREWERFISHS
jgi:hypothetical protein